MANITEKERTFLVLKYGEHYRIKIIDAWYADSSVNFGETERKIVLEWHKRMGGILQNEPKDTNEQR